MILVDIFPPQKGNLGRRGLGLKTSAGRYLSPVICSFYRIVRSVDFPINFLDDDIDFNSF
jgi:hypothetical protein